MSRFFATLTLCLSIPIGGGAGYFMAVSTVEAAFQSAEKDAAIEKLEQALRDKSWGCHTPRQKLGGRGKLEA